MSMINDVRDFMQAGGQTTDEFNVRQYAMYTGLQLEEIAEKMRAVELYFIASNLDDYSKNFKAGDYDQRIKQSMAKAELLDADIDLAFVSIGSMLSMSTRPGGAWDEVVRSNMSKINPETWKMDRDENGKIIKSSVYSKPDLSPFVPTEKTK